jgi:hypothetical protein
MIHASIHAPSDITETPYKTNAKLALTIAIHAQRQIYVHNVSAQIIYSQH